MTNQGIKKTSADKAQLIGWRTDAGNRAGTAHVYLRIDGPGKPLARALCSREVLVSDLQAEIVSLKRCRRCQVAAAKLV